MPIRRNVTSKSERVPPYRVLAETMWSPASRRVRRAVVSAACPEAVASEARPFSSAAIRSSKTAVVGFISRV